MDICLANDLISACIAGIFFILALTTSTCIIRFFRRVHERPKIYLLEPDIGEWLNIKKTPIPEEIIDEELIVSDGEKVTARSIRYNSSGEAILGYGSYSSKVTHWRPFPKPPEKE